MKSSFEQKCKILGQLWSEFKDEEGWEDFVDFNDISLPLAFLLDMKMAENPSSLAINFIEQTFVSLLTRVNLEDAGWESLEDILDAIHEEKE